MDRTQLTLNCAGRINGKLLRVEGRGHGRVQEGTFELALRFFDLPHQYPIAVSALWTCCSTPSFAIESNGALNMLTLSKGRYKCQRRFDFGRGGFYDYNYELRMSSDGTEMEATGLIEGDLNLPEVHFLEKSFSEVMIPTSDAHIASYVTSQFSQLDGKSVQVRATGQYSPIEGAERWGCSQMVIERQRPQVRTSFIEDLEEGEDTLRLRYLTVIKGIDTPVISRAELEQELAR